jgi:metal transporter CNNM
MITIKKIPRKATTSSILILFSPLILMSGSDGDDSRIRSSDNTILLDSDYPFDYSRGRILQDSLQADVPIPNYAKVILVIGLATLSALLSGLTLGLMSLDSTQLEILMNNRAIDAKSAAYAKNIYPVRANNKGNLLLCTLIWAMVGANVFLSILLSSILSPLAGFLVSTFVLVVGTEILPLAVCNRYALVIGGYSAPIVRILMIMFLPIAYPLAAILDRILGKELGTIYSKTEFQHLLNIHTNRGIPGYSKDTTAAMTGALLYQDYTVQQIMTPIQNVYMLSSDVKLNYDNILQIFKAGYSRIPIYQGDNKNDILGLLLTKDLIFLDPSDNISIEAFISIFGRGK